MEHLEAIAGQICELAGDAEAQSLVSRSRYGLTRFANSFIHQHHGEDTTSAEVKLAVDGKVASASTTDVSDEGLARLVEDARAIASLQPDDPHWPGVIGPTDVPDRDQVAEATIDAVPSDRVEAVAAFIEEGADLSAAGFLDTGVTEVAVATTGGQVVSGRSTRATLDGIHQTPVSAGNAHHTSLDFTTIDGSSAGRRAVDLARRGVDPVDLDPGRYEVVLSPECAATIAVFLGVYGFGGQSFVDGQSFVEIGSEQFDPSFRLTDDPADPRAISLAFDSDGSPKHTLALVESGVSRAVAHDRRTAKRADAASTGHANPGGFGPLPLDLVIGAGDHTVDELVAGVERGVYVSTFNYCRILDPRTQVVTGLTRNGTFLIENGEISRPLTNLRFTQSFVEALGPGSIEAIGSDQRFADSEFGPGFVIAPSLRLASWTFTGGAQG